MIISLKIFGYRISIRDSQGKPKEKRLRLTLQFSSFFFILGEIDHSKRARRNAHVLSCQRPLSAHETDDKCTLVALRYIHNPYKF